MAFFERGDLDLLLSSPLPSRRVLTVRAVGIATTPFLWFAAILTIVILPLAAVGEVRWLAVYPMLAAIALLASATGVSLAMALFRLLGARRTRTVGQLIAAFIGAACSRRISPCPGPPGRFSASRCRSSPSSVFRSSPSRG
jgi:ABC-2 type transport system permease protein